LGLLLLYFGIKGTCMPISICMTFNGSFLDISMNLENAGDFALWFTENYALAPCEDFDVILLIPF
ncbi:hypothetical protein ACJX0J_021968, partial [Zea mays]